ncbi:hypothetical protein ABEB36_007380 [Hypothenemus hampei]|uniref:Uncharacterized protein n=1 Tax=Hypothenemus hampei TaxID=57062 RepID=A0ABD1ETS2_HYPHA
MTFFVSSYTTESALRGPLYRGSTVLLFMTIPSAVNRHNCRYWSNSNPYLFRVVHSQHPQILNV